MKISLYAKHKYGPKMFLQGNVSNSMFFLSYELVEEVVSYARCGLVTVIKSSSGVEIHLFNHA